MTPLGYRACKEMTERELTVQGELVRLDAPQCLFVPFLIGPPGIGKTSIARELSVELDRELVTFNGGEASDPTEILGFGLPSEAGGDLIIRWALTEQAKMACEKPCLLFFDDVDKAEPVIQGALLNITGNRRIRTKLLHPETLIILAGNGVGEDMFANPICESLRTRITPIAMKADLADFTAYGQKSEEIHPHVLGYLWWSKEDLHKQISDTQDRMPTPRGWWELSQYMFGYEDPDEIVGPGAPANWHWAACRKVGEPTGNNFWSWFTVMRHIDVKRILTDGTFELKGDHSDVMGSFAAVYAVSMHLNKLNEVRKSYSGLDTFIKALAPEMQVALGVQLTQSIRSSIRRVFPEAAAKIVAGAVL